MEGSPGDWSAEFHNGNLHRVENAFNRIVADCAKMTGAALDLAAGEIDRRDWVAKAACGIQSINAPLSSEWLGQVKTPFGDADRIRIADDVSTRTYDVLKNGALVSSTFRPASGGPEVISKAREVSAALPSASIFSESSLVTSVVPEQYRSQPTDSPNQ